MRKTRYFQSIVTFFLALLFSLIPFLMEPSLSEPIPLETQVEEFDIRYKKQIPLYLQHDLGDVILQGWNQDLVRVRLIKVIPASNSLETQGLLKKFSLISLETPKSLELRVGSPQGTDLLSKLKNRQLKTKIRVNLEIKAPATMDLSMVLGEGRNLTLNQWRGKATLHGWKSTVDFLKVRAKNPVNLNCKDCKLTVVDSELSGNFILGDQPAKFKKTISESGSIQIHLRNGNLELEDTQGHFQVRQDHANFTSRSHQGTIQALLNHGQTTMVDFEGDLDLQGENSSYQLHVNKVNRQLKIKNQEGSIEVSMPHRFCGEVSLQSIQGDVLAEFPIENLSKPSNESYGPEVKGRIAGITCSPSKGLVEVNSELGVIHLKQRELNP